MSSFQQWSTMPSESYPDKNVYDGKRTSYWIRQNLLDGYSSFTKFHHFLNSLSNVIGHIYIRYLPSPHRVCFFHSCCRQFCWTLENLKPLHEVIQPLRYDSQLALS